MRGGAGEVRELEVLIICNLAEYGKELSLFFFLHEVKTIGTFEQSGQI